jgi:hypothetical protein
MTQSTQSVGNVHIALIDFPAFYEGVFPNAKAARDFYSEVDRLPPNHNTAKVVLHQTARMVWLADKIDEVARGRPAFQILFYLIAAELVAKLVFNFKGRGKVWYHVLKFFTEICGDETKVRLGNSFKRTPYGDVSAKDAVGLLYDVRCNVAHEGMYYNFSLPLNQTEGPVLVNVGEESFTTDLRIEEVRRMVLEGAVLASRKSLKAASMGNP